MQRENNVHALTTYVSDMLALERHVRVPFEAQAKDDDFGAFDGASQLVTEILRASDEHVDRLDACLARLGGHEASGVKSSVTQIAGLFAGAIDKMRKTKVSKALRDDYTALALCSAGYSALLATANGLGNPEVAGLAQRMLADYAGLVMEIGDALPSIVVKELDADTDLRVDVSTVEESRQAVTSAWRSEARAVAPGEV
jgi:ferritin-like metal-binding protein YciE